VRRLLVVCLLLIVGTEFAGLQGPPPLPTRPDSLKFAVIGDTGTGERPQYEVGARMAAIRTIFPFEMVLMLGDNMYGSQRPEDFVTKFERPYAALLREGVRFYAALGNHDNPQNRSYSRFNMGGERYYTFVNKGVRFLVLDTTSLDPRQLAWIDDVMKRASERWRICYFHHPLYSSARRHGSSVELRVVLEPLLVKHGINVVFAGHDHTYERLKPQKGVTHFVAGSGGKLAKGDVRPSPMTAAFFDQDQAFVVVEIIGDDLFFQAISRLGQSVDAGTIHRQPPNPQREQP
jgi:hypothetical protein